MTKIIPPEKKYSKCELEYRDRVVSVWKTALAKRELAQSGLYMAEYLLLEAEIKATAAHTLYRAMAGDGQVDDRLACAKGSIVNTVWHEARRNGSY